VRKARFVPGASQSSSGNEEGLARSSVDRLGAVSEARISRKALQSRCARSLLDAFADFEATPLLIAPHEKLEAAPGDHAEKESRKESYSH
jgi:hypothetical protein